MFRIVFDIKEEGAAEIRSCGHRAAMRKSAHSNGNFPGTLCLKRTMVRSRADLEEVGNPQEMDSIGEVVSERPRISSFITHEECLAMEGDGWSAE